MDGEIGGLRYKDRTQRMLALVEFRFDRIANRPDGI